MKFFNDLWRIISTPDFRGYLFQGFGNTLVITICSAIIGLLIGFTVAIIKILAQDSKALKIPWIICEIYTTIIRGTPVALQLFIMVLQILVIPNVDMQTFAIILTFGINSGAYVSESIRAGIQSVDKGQMEAGRALGLTKMKTMTKIILPQAIKNVIPAIGNELVVNIKDTSVLSVISVMDLFFVIDSINGRSASNDAIFIAAIIYLCLTFGISKLLGLLEKKMNLVSKPLPSSN